MCIIFFCREGLVRCDCRKFLGMQLEFTAELNALISGKQNLAVCLKPRYYISIFVVLNTFLETDCFSCRALYLACT